MIVNGHSGARCLRARGGHPDDAKTKNAALKGGVSKEREMEERP